MRRVRHGWRWLSGLCALPLLAMSALGHAQEPLLHEYVPNLQPNEGDIVLGELTGMGTIEYEGEVLTAPSGGEASQSAPPLSASPGDGLRGEQPGRRSPSFRPDRQTSLEGQLDYYEAFTPAIAPFKRVSALDGVALDRDGVTPLLVLHDVRKREVPVETSDAPAPDARPRDRFFGEVVLDFREGRDVPLPSVSPHSRILHVMTSPQVTLRIERDGADNFYARVVGDVPAQPVRMMFLTDAPRAYFGAEILPAPVGVFAREVRPLPPSVAARARTFAGELGIDDKTTLRAAIETLTRYFREWTESQTPPKDTGDIYLDLVRGKKGVCRHRAYGFVVTALALGIPARFVQNEAHSWVEIKVPTHGFLRIDLGGAAHGMTAHGAADRPVYVPSEPDPLPRPESYRNSYSTLNQGVTGLRPTFESVQGRWVSPSSADTDEASAWFVADSKAPTPTPASSEERRPLRLTLQERASTALRGGKVSVSGRLTSEAGAGVPGLRVEISLAASTRKERMLLGVTVTDEHGYFQAEPGIPTDLAVGDYSLIVLSPGDARYLPVIAQ